jgi:hypothetical protein
LMLLSTLSISNDLHSTESRPEAQSRLSLNQNKCHEFAAAESAWRQLSRKIRDGPRCAHIPQ